MSSLPHVNTSSNSLISEISSSLWIPSSFIPILKALSQFAGLNGTSSTSSCGTGRLWFSLFPQRVVFLLSFSHRSYFKMTFPTTFLCAFHYRFVHRGD
ncbi:hypothetical protein LIER_28712 [Lithospermum erythrorhizon]|uniref:Uncharacterized protein n=1 Tax=Lithospermum erythrorhizon TaxID=34254 RepID=A0AAV3RGN2_LITER